MNRLRVLTFNIWNRNGPWDGRLPLIRKGLERLGPDVVGLQEIMAHDGRTQADEIAHGLDYLSAFGPAHDLGGGVLFGNAILSRWPILRSEALELPTKGTDEKRCLFFAEIDSPMGKLPVFVTHLNWKFHHGVVRESQVVAIAKRVKELAPIDGLPPILMGDFNAQPESAEIRFLKGLQSLEGRSFFMADSFEQVGEGPGYTFDARQNPFAATTHEPPRRIDYVFVRGPDRKARGIPRSARVVLDEVEDGVAASDHYGVLVELSM